MTDIREKVARALVMAEWDASNICDQQVKERNAASDFEKGPLRSYWLASADAALTACGYWEMRRALSHLLDNYPIRDDDFEIARAALSKAGKT